MSASLVGSEMCIRDRPKPRALSERCSGLGAGQVAWPEAAEHASSAAPAACLLYTSDAADDM
eukprot:10465919-Alexandrium_andersonii.AAC.1